MADQAANVVHKTQNRGGTNAYPIANGVTLYPGTLVSLEGGYLNHWADGANDVLIGVVAGDAIGISPGSALTGDTSASVVPEARVDESGVTLMHLDSVGGTPTQAKVGDYVYGATSNSDDLTLDATGATNPVGYLSRFRSATDVDVTLFTPAEFLAGGVTPSIDFIEQTVAFDDFTDGGGTSGTLVLSETVPVGAILLGSKVTVATGFTGDTTAALTIGDGSDVDRYNTGTPSVLAAAANGIQTGVPSGNKLITTANTPTLTVTGAADFTSISAGAMTVRIYYIVT